MFFFISPDADGHWFLERKESLISLCMHRLRIMELEFVFLSDIMISFL